MTTTGNNYLSGWRFRWYQAGALFHAWQIARQAYPTFQQAWRAVWGLVQNNRANNRYRHLTKAVRVDGRDYSMMSMPGRPSAGMDTLLRNELHRIVPIPGFTKGLLLLFLAITKKCSMRCAHCFEWEALNHREVLSVNDLVLIIQKFQASGLATIELSGGEPMNRFADLLELLERSDTRQTDFWVVSSGYRLSSTRAQQLKAAGLTGVSISVDHWNAAEHDQFRGLPGAFEQALQAARNAHSAGLVVGLNLVPSRAFCTREHLMRYLNLGKSLGVHFIRILEPRAVGHYAGAEVELTKAQWSVIEDFHREVQTGAAYRNHPLVEYHGTFQRNMGCGGAGDRFLYVDTDGDVHACPLCRQKSGNAVRDPIENSLSSVRHGGACQAYQLVTEPVLLES